MESGERSVIVIGGGLAGLIAANELAQKGYSVTLVDSPLPQAGGVLGGFARFSGAKFSLPPAGMGLVGVAGNESKLIHAVDAVLRLLGIQFRTGDCSVDQLIHLQEGSELELRKYNSIVLSPAEMTEVVVKLTKQVVGRARVEIGSCVSVARAGDRWICVVEQGTAQRRMSAKLLVLATGRLTSIGPSELGAKPTGGKGLDVGFRVEFADGGLEALRRFGPDAKILRGNCRTFCLNVPGQIYHHEFENVRIPGGIVADRLTKASNVGLLCRLQVDKERWKAEFVERAGGLQSELESAWPGAGSPASSIRPLLERLYGTDASEALVSFSEDLGTAGLIDWNRPHEFHLPLLDWYWPTFAHPSSFQTSVDDLYVIGDVSGHARGLLQAAISGWLLGKSLS